MIMYSNVQCMPSNRAKDRALTLTPRKKRNEGNTGSIPTTLRHHKRMEMPDHTMQTYR